MQKLISFIIPSRRLDNIEGFFENIEKTVSDPSCVEVLVKFDDDQAGVIDFIENEIRRRPFTIKYVITPRFEGIYSVWVAMEQLFFMTDPNTYFIQVLSDEPRFQTEHWDKILRKYIGFFKDDVFRLRLSCMKFANYPSHYECTFRPDSFPIYTRRWLELTEGTGNCWGSDAYQQCVAFHLSLGPGSHLNVYRENAFCRDVVVNDIDLYGLEFGVGVSEEEKRERHKRNLREWNRLTTFVMQEHFSYLARRINCYIWACEEGIKDFRLLRRENRKTVAVVDAEGRILEEMSYAVPRLVIYVQNLSRNMLIYPRHLLIRLLGMVKRFLYKTKILPVFKWTLRTTAKGLAKLPFIPEETRRALLAYSKYKAPGELDDTVSARRKLKKTLLAIFFVVFSPVYFLTKYLDRLLTRSPPGISALTKKPDIPKRIKKPNKTQIDWLKAELNSQENHRNGLRNKMFGDKAGVNHEQAKQQEISESELLKNV